jgi:photosystem II stability/assembly factor-like uncharacterized protein
MKTTFLFFAIIIFLTPYTDLSSQNKSYKYYNDCDLWQIEDTFGNSILNTNLVYTWQFMQTSTISQIMDIVFKDTLTGWASHTANGATMTTNGGINWTEIFFNDTNFTTLYNGIFFLNQLTGWCVGGAVQIRKTTNGGLNWFKQTAPPVSGVLNKVHFFDENTGIVIGRKGINYNSFMAKTTNGGNNWSEIVVSTVSENELSGQHWFDFNTGWICGKSILLKTTDGGQNFTNFYSSIPPTSNGINALLCITFVNQQTGWIGGSNLDKKNIYISTNGGLNWVFQNNPVTLNTYTQINDMGFLSADSGWAIHGTPATGAIMFTTNSGLNWIVEEGSSNWFNCLSIYQHRKAWVGSSAGKVWYTYLTSLVGVKKISGNIPEKCALSQNYPNPFNPVTKVKFDIKKLAAGSQESVVSLMVFDITGKEVATLVNELLQPGTYEVSFDGGNLPGGVYFYKLQAGNYADVKKMILIK